MASVIIRLLNALGKAGTGLANFINSIVVAAWMLPAEVEAISKWLQSSPYVQQQIVDQLPTLSPAIEGLLLEVQQSQEVMFQIHLLKRIALTLPALPSEGF